MKNSFFVAFNKFFFEITATNNIYNKNNNRHYNTRVLTPKLTYTY